MKYKNSVWRSFTMVTQLGLCILTPLLLCLALGVWIRNRFGFDLILILLIVGVLAGARNGYVMMKNVLDQNRREDEQEKARKRKRLK